MGVPTFGYLRIEAYLQLPEAFRSLSRPSSAPDAKAFSICSSMLELPSVISSLIFGCSLLELLCLRTFSFFTVTLACLIIAFGKINSFCYLLY